MKRLKGLKLYGTVTVLALLAFFALFGLAAARHVPGAASSSGDVHLEWGEGTVLAIDDEQIEVALDGDPGNTVTVRLGVKKQLIYYDEDIDAGSYIYFAYLTGTDEKGPRSLYAASLTPYGPDYPDSEVERKLQEERDALPWRNAQ